MEDSRTSTSSQRLASTFDTLIESPEAYITAIIDVRPEPFPTGNNRDIPPSVQELFYGRKTKGVRASTKSLERQNELLSSSEEVHGPRKDRGPYEGLEPHFFQRKISKEKSLVEKPKHVVRGQEEEDVPRKRQQPSGSSSSLHTQESATKSAKKGQSSPKEQSEGQEKGKV
ncbi:hypothetical protein O181_100604 [Austropuccinia psidii MF-1]|uniref:Uncharacterized protein n=1 Tax=Austropuccinia psidii MF-1 TaxID=1389203 RepID=A0A9Q3JFJ0_9BASI|nr:hypothetical protein [Austropuccinia psidii MF-1]